MRPTLLGQRPKGATNIPEPTDEPEYVLSRLNVTQPIKDWGKRLIDLLRSTFPEVAKDKRHWRVAEVPLPPKTRMLIVPGAPQEADNGVNIALLLHPKPEERFIRFSLLGDMATTALLGVVNAKTGMSESVNRETFPNDCWDSFVGWMAVTKDEYDKYHRPRMRVYKVRERITFWDVKVSQVCRFTKDDLLAVAADYKAILHHQTGAHIATVDPDEVLRAIAAKAIEAEGVTGPKQITSKGIPYKYLALGVVYHSSSPGVPPLSFKQGDTINFIEVPGKDNPYLAVPWPPQDPVGEIAVPLTTTWREIKERQAAGDLEPVPVEATTPAPPKTPDTRKFKMLPGCMFSVALKDGFHGFTTKDTILLTDTHTTIVQGDGKVQPSTDDPTLRGFIDAAIHQGVLSQVGGPLLWNLYVASKKDLILLTPSERLKDGSLVKDEDIEIGHNQTVALTPEIGLIALAQPGRVGWDNYPLNDEGEKVVRGWIRDGLLVAVEDKRNLTDDDLDAAFKNPLDAEITMPEKARWTQTEEGSPADPVE